MGLWQMEDTQGRRSVLRIWSSSRHERTSGGVRSSDRSEERNTGWTSISTCPRTGMRYSGMP